MDTITIAVIILVVGAVFLIFKMPIAFLLLIIGFVGFGIVRGFGIASDMIGGRLFDINKNYELSVVPLFLLMGDLAYAAGITQQLFSAARAMLGNIRGGLLVATTVANAVFGACCGSTTAAVAVFGKVAIPEMLKAGVDRKLAAGSVAAGGILSGIIPPSVIIVIYGILGQVSIAKTLIAGVVPGILTAAVFIAMIAARVKINPTLSPISKEASMSTKDKFQALRGVWGVLVLALLIMGGIYSGTFTPTEAGAIGSMGAFILVATARKMKLSVLKEAFIGTAKVTAIVFIVVNGAMIFAAYLAMSGITGSLSGWLVNLAVPSVVIVIGIMILYLIMGCLFDPISMMVLTIPIMIPILKQLGVDLVWLGILTTKMACLGMITPPMGLNCFMLKTVCPDLSLSEIFKGSIPFVIADLVLMAVLIAFPIITVALPNVMIK